MQKSHIWGVSCDGADDLGERRVPELSEGDWVVYPEIGDYCNELNTVSFNGFYPPEMIYCCDQRHSQTLQYLLAEPEFKFIDLIEFESQQISSTY